MYDILRQCGYPERVLTLDFETYFDGEYSLKEMSAIEYVTDSRFETTAVGLKIDNKPAECVCQDDNYDDYRHFLALGWASFTVLCHNSAFDLLILKHHFGIEPPYILDTLALARHWDSRSKHDLGSLCKRFKLPDKGNTEDFSGWTFRDRFYASGRSKARKQRPIFTQEKIAAMQSYCCNDIEQTYKLAKILLPKLSNPATELKLIKHTLDLALKPLLDFDDIKANDLIRDMQIEIDLAVADTGHTKEEISGNKSYERILCDALLANGDDTSRYFKTTAKGNRKIADSKTDDAGEKLLHHKAEAVRKVATARKAVKSWPLHIGRVTRMQQMAKAWGGKLGVPLNYHGAHTGRWSGAGKINLQNLPKQGHELIVAMRGLLLAPPGHKLVIVDASQIEARVLAWAAGQDDLCDKFRRKDDVYCEFASKVLGFRVVKADKDKCIPAIGKRLRWARDSIGKIGVLGCGYGMGARKAEGYAQGAIDFGMAERIVQTYRREHPRIVEYWYRVERAFRAVAKRLPPIALGLGVVIHSLPDCDVCITLPNKRRLYYHRVKITPDSIEVWNDLENHWERTWGGSLVENIVQAISRDILAKAILVYSDGVVLHAHDEIVFCVPDSLAEERLMDAIVTMSTAPAWATDCPLAAEGHIAERYCK